MKIFVNLICVLSLNACEATIESAPTVPRTEDPPLTERCGAAPGFVGQRSARELISLMVFHIEHPSVGPAGRRALNAELDAESLAAFDGGRRVPYDDLPLVRIWVLRGTHIYDCWLRYLNAGYADGSSAACVPAM